MINCDVTPAMVLPFPGVHKLEGRDPIKQGGQTFLITGQFSKDEDTEGHNKQFSA
jgi:hypothetical protein